MNGPTRDSPKRTDQPKTIDQLVESFVGRLRTGEQVSITEYELAHPHLAEEIRQLFPSLEMLERCRPQEEVQAAQRFDADDIPPDQLGEYRIVREIGRGGMGIVYEADHIPMQRRVALKVLPKSVALQASNVARFHQEARSAGQLHHTNIVPVFEVGEEGGFHFYSMQFIRGQNLDLILDDIRALRGSSGVAGGDESQGRDGPVGSSRGELDEMSQTVAFRMVNGGLPESSDEEPHELAVAFDDRSGSGSSDTLRTGERGSSSNVFGSSEWSLGGRGRNAYFCRVAALGLQVADALEHAHQNELLHRDIKPANLILDTDGIVWITDFGLAKGLEDDLTQSGDIVGTLRYMAPERFSGQTDNRSDIYSLGLTLYELCTMRAAFQNTDRAELVESVIQRTPVAPRLLEPMLPLDLETIILKAIDRSPDRRYRTSQQLAEDLQAFLADRPIQARRITSLERLWRTCRRNPLAATMSAISLLLLVTVAVGATISALHSNRQAGQLRVQARELQVQNERAARHLSLTVETIDKMLNRVGHDLAGVPQMDEMRHGLFSEALALQKEVLALEPGNPEVVMQTIAAYRRTAAIQKQIGQYGEARKSLEEAMALIEAIPGNGPDKLFEKGQTHAALASWLRIRGDLRDAIDQSHLAIKALESISEADMRPQHSVGLATARRTLGAILEQTGQTHESERVLRSSLETLNGLEVAIGHSEQLIPLTESLNSLAVLCRTSGRFAEAEQHYRRVIELCNENRELAVGRIDILDQLGISALNLGNLLMFQRRHDEASEAYELASETFEQLQRDFPLTIRFQRSVARTKLSLGMIYSARKQTEEAEFAYTLAIHQSELIESVYGSDPMSLDTQAVALNNLGNLLKAQKGRLKEAVSAFETAIRLRSGRAGGLHSNPTNTKSLALVRVNLADALADQHEFERAHAACLQAYEEISDVVAKHPTNPSFRSVADFVCGQLSHLTAEMGRYDEVVLWVNRLAQLKPSAAEHQIKSARQLAPAVKWSRADASFDASARERQLAAYARCAIDLIIGAVELGWEPDEAFRNSESFAWLRDNEELKSLLP